MTVAFEEFCGIQMDTFTVFAVISTLGAYKIIQSDEIQIPHD